MEGVGRSSTLPGPGAAHGPHHVAKEWADKYQGAFDDGWDACRERVFARQKATRLDTR